MRVDIDLDADAYAIASSYARARGIALGAAISALLRRAEGAPELRSAALTRNRRGLLVVAKAGRVVTPEMVKKFSEDEFG